MIATFYVLVILVEYSSKCVTIEIVQISFTFFWTTDYVVIEWNSLINNALY